MDLNLDAYWWSESALTLLGISADDAPHDYAGFLALIHPDDRSKLDELYTGSLEQFTPYRNQFRVVKPDGSIVVLEGRCETWFSEDAEPIYSIGTLQNVTEWRQREAELVRTYEEADRLKEYTEYVVQNSPSIIVAIDGASRIKEINEAGCALLA